MGNVFGERPKKTKHAIALQYDPQIHDAPTVVGAGEGYVAEKILQTAQENDIPIHRDAKLAEAMSALSPGMKIPEELYEVVAQVLVFISQTDSDYRNTVLKYRQDLR